MTLSREERLRQAFQKSGSFSLAGHVRNKRNNNGVALKEDVEAQRPKVPPPAAAAIPDTPDTDNFDPLAGLRPSFIAWFNRNVQLEVEWHAIIPPRPEARWSTGLLFLHRHLCAWWPEHSAEIPPDLTDETLLLESGAVITTIRGERLVQRVALAEDLSSHRRFNDAPQGLPRPARAVVVVKPEPRYELTYDDQGRPVMPHGVRLVGWASLPSPARLSNCSLVTNVDTFIRITLIQLDHALHNRSWLAGN
jgi:hypothetical protein